MEPLDDLTCRDRPTRVSPAAVHRMGEVLEEWRAQFQRKFPDLPLHGTEPPTAVQGTAAA